MSDSYQDLVSKKNLCLLGKDIWAEEESWGEGMEMCGEAWNGRAGE